MNTKELQYLIALTLIPKIGCVNAKNLIAYTGSAEAVFKEPKSKLQKIPGIGSLLANNISSQGVLARAENELNFIIKNKIKAISYLDKNYPYRLKQCNDSPVVLFVKGEVEANPKHSISIVGTRKSTEYGKNLCEKLIEDLISKNYNPVIVSGLAYGTDVTAHKLALKYNLKTIGVLAHGLDTLYPSQHAEVARKMIDSGGSLVTEFLSETKMDRKYFLQRNRIVAGFSDAIVVIESAAKGGSLTTAEIANSYSREVCTYPARVGDKMSEGCNYLIKKHKAALIENANDLIERLNWDIEEKKESKFIQPTIFNNLNKEEQKILEVIREAKEISLDLISLRSEISIDKAASLLLNLEFTGYVKNLPGKIFKLK